MRTSLSSSVAKIVLCTLFAILAISSAFAGVNGAIYTTFPAGTTVNGNIYPSKDQVYLSGGPQNKKDAGLSPAPDFYYFQVTDPSGSVLLSKDAVTCRVVYVNNSGGPGIVDGVPGTDGSDSSAGGFGTPACYHNNGTQDDANGALPVQLCNPNSSLCPTDFADTPNPGGEYKAWMTPVEDYVGPNGTCPTGANHFGFCDSLSKTDNFKIKTPGTAAITACKFIDTETPPDGTYDPQNGDFFFAGWPITATDTLNGTTVTQNTDQDGCTTFEFPIPKNSTDSVTLTEGPNASYTQVAPTDCTTLVSSDSGVGCSVTGGVVTLTKIGQDDVITAPLFGNAPGQNGPPPVSVSKTASGGNNFVWNVAKSVDKTEIDDSNGNATFNYTVTVTHDAGTGWVVGGVISLVNPDPNNDVLVSSVADSTSPLADLGCTVPGGTNVTVPHGGAPVNLNYTCTFTTNPGPGTNTATADTLTPATAAFDFSAADTSAAITDTIAKNLGTVTINADNSTSCPASAPAGFVGTNWACSVDPKTGTATFTYSETFTDPAGTCTSHDNTATFTTNTNTTGNSTDVTVKQCVGKDLTVVKTAAASFNSSVSKSVDKTKVEQSGGNVTFNYTVTVSEDTWLVKGTITVSNPNDWESITANVTDSIDGGGSCVVTGGTGVVIAASGSSGALPYTCTYAVRPTLVTGTNTGTATVTAGITPNSAVTGTAGYTFATLTITDNVQSSTYPGPTGCNATLGTVSVTTTTPSATPGCGVTGLTSPSWGVFKYSITDTNASPGTCTSYNNTAQITGGSSSGQVTVTVCNTGTGALTMGFWKNTNGAKIISAGGTTGGVCNSATWLHQFNPYQDVPLSSCKNVASYVATTIGGATCSSGGTCNTMLRAQMLSTALDVYFSTPGLGGNQIGAYNGLGSKTPALGGVAIDLSHICSMADGSSGSTCTGAYEDARPEFGITPPCLGTTVGQMLLYANASSVPNGSPVASSPKGAAWYLQIKTRQVYAKDGFDNINNQIANIAPTSCSPSF